MLYMFIVTLLFLLYFVSFVGCSVSAKSHFECLRNATNTAVCGSTFSKDNIPGHRRNAVFWTFNHSAYLFGGAGKCCSGCTGTSNSDRGYLGDMWEYRPSIDMWRFVKGDKDQRCKDKLDADNKQFHPDNQPACREGHAYFYGLEPHRFLIFGGIVEEVKWLNTMEARNDVWEYDVLKNQWRMLYERTDPGEHDPDYNAGRPPHVGFASAVTYENSSYIFGGCDFDGDQWKYESAWNDVWRFDLKTHKFEFHDGSKTKDCLTSFDDSNPNSTIGMRPSCRCGHVSFLVKDEMFIFGGGRRGFSCDFNGNKPDYFLFKNDQVWAYNIPKKRWRFVHGRYFENSGPIVHKPGQFDDGNYISSRHLFFHTVNSGGFLWVGQGLDGMNFMTQDLWIFDYMTVQWKFVAGSKFTWKNPDNFPPKRYAGASVHVDGVAYFFGGNTQTDEESFLANRNDLWKWSIKEYRCFGIYYEQEEVCSGHGKCTDRDVCKCSNPFYGKLCEYEYVPPQGGGGGGDPANILTNELSAGQQFLLYVFLPLSLICVLISCCCICCFLLILLCFCLLIVCCGVILVGMLAASGICLGCLGVGSCSLCGCLFFSLRKKLLKFEKLENFDMILKEQEAEKDNSMAHLKIDKSLFEIPYEELIIERLIGEGGSGAVVFRAKWKDNDVAFKCFKTRRICESQEKFDDFEKEVNLLVSLNHPNIIRFFGASLKPPRVGFVMEYCEKGELLPFVQDYRDEKGIGYPMEEKLRMCQQIISAIGYCHSRNIIHRDIKSENVLIDVSENCKLMDFGISRIAESTSGNAKTKRVGTSIYIAPEVVAGVYDTQCDSFSFSILLWVLFSEDEEPYENCDNVELRVASDPNFRPRLGKLSNSFGNDRRKYQWIVNIMKKCWDQDPDIRLNFSELADVFKKQRFGSPASPPSRAPRSPPTTPTPRSPRGPPPKRFPPKRKKPPLPPAKSRRPPSGRPPSRVSSYRSHE